jgi:hypothetical protein
VLAVVVGPKDVVGVMMGVATVEGTVERELCEDARLSGTLSECFTSWSFSSRIRLIFRGFAQPSSPSCESRFLLLVDSTRGT